MNQTSYHSYCVARQEELSPLELSNALSGVHQVSHRSDASSVNGFAHPGHYSEENEVIHFLFSSNCSSCSQAYRHSTTTSKRVGRRMSDFTLNSPKLGNMSLRTLTRITLMIKAICALPMGITSQARWVMTMFQVWATCCLLHALVTGTTNGLPTRLQLLLDHSATLAHWYISLINIYHANANAPVRATHWLKAPRITPCTA